MPRTNADAVKAILAPGKDYDERKKPSLDPFIAVAESMVNNVVSMCTIWEIDVPSDDDLATLAGWIAAWAYKNSDQQLATSTARSSASFKGQTGKGLESNHYGQTAMTMDPTGLLGSTTLGTNFVGGTWTGRPPSAQTPYRQRN